jgi:hypothetical protein
MTTDIHQRFGDDLPPYGKGGAGYRDDEASRDGARKVNRDGTRATQCDFAMAVVERAGPDGISSYGVYETPGGTFRDLSTCRARLSDLKAQGKIVKKGERTPGEAGISVNLWIAARYAPPADADPQGDMFADAAPAPAPAPARGNRPMLSIRKPTGIQGLLARYAPKAA